MDRTGHEQQPLALEVEGLTYSYAGQREPAICDLSFSVEPGRLVGVVGPNGAGKSTLVKCIVGALEPDVGSVAVMGQRGKRAIRRLTYVPQRGAVDWDFPVTVGDVVRQGRWGKLGLLGRFGQEDRRKVAEALEKVGIEELADRQIGELSGGQQQRVFLARALAHDGDVFLMDEPFVGVDARTEAAIVEVLRALRDEGRAVLVVHHDLSSLREYFDELILLNRRLVAHGPTDQVFCPELLQRAYGGKLAVFDEGRGGRGLAVM